jgi:hypothetical protein
LVYPAVQSLQNAYLFPRKTAPPIDASIQQWARV